MRSSTKCSSIVLMRPTTIVKIAFRCKFTIFFCSFENSVSVSLTIIHFQLAHRKQCATDESNNEWRIQVKLYFQCSQHATHVHTQMTAKQIHRRNRHEIQIESKLYVNIKLPAQVYGEKMRRQMKLVSLQFDGNKPRVLIRMNCQKSTCFHISHNFDRIPCVDEDFVKCVCVYVRALWCALHSHAAIEMKILPKRCRRYQRIIFVCFFCYLFYIACNHSISCA